MSLEELIKGCKKHDTKAQSQLYKLYASKLFSLCLKYSKNYAEAEDNLQDAFVTIFNKIEQYKNKGSFEGWIKRVTINTALQRYRSVKVFDIINEDAIEDVEVDIINEDISLDFLLNIIQELPDRYRLVFNLYVLDGYSHNEIGELMKISSGTSKSNLARARLILKQKIEAYKANLNSQSL
ncbi:RNA polymerase sigma factor [Winogradskyella immobilis]|uniref:Sigma-70 family RNA polymerase sigma factor n=1 Tax=Winogradskyella immobilis TaxID=2816852 RepID=A0ABS8ER88_9FLAO|nr:sigma-70 family RNA polymerase sigma factor [Winogradskyella immobilis]MCC1485522.1 sigma-70 family RNA polymerase sigma factor [Winogradskyella immobilis]MCG0017614.1 sigma-70 family RNA polymerase sigma factor [Winogradskyella immobilis]